MKGDTSEDPTERPNSKLMVPSQQPALTLVASAAAEDSRSQLITSAIAPDDQVVRMKSTSCFDQSNTSSLSTTFEYTCSSRALSLRNLVSGYDCGRVFPASVGPGSPSKDAVNWLPSRFSLSVETRRRYGWLRMMVFPGAHLFRAPIWCPSGGWWHARGRDITVAEIPVVLYRVGTHQIRRRRRAARSSTSQGRVEPLCARITGLNREVSEGKADV